MPDRVLVAGEEMVATLSPSGQINLSSLAPAPRLTGPNRGGRWPTVYGGPFCYRMMRWLDLSNPVSEQWYGAHIVPTRAVLEDAAERNAALQRHQRGIRREREAAEQSAKAVRRRR